MLQRLKNTGQVPNFLSTLRLITAWVPMFILITTPHDNLGWRLMALGIFVIIVLTDMLDGHLARSWKQVSAYGKLVDPLADKALVVLTMIGICLTTPIFRQIGWIILALIIVRESLVSILRVVRRRRDNLVIPANMHGKTKMVLQSAALILAFLPSPFWGAASILVFGCSLPFAWLSARDYIRAE